MESLIAVILNYTSNYFFIAALLVIFTSYFFLRTRNRKLPPGPTGVPVLGYLPFLGKDFHLDLQNLSKKYGDVFGLYLGRNYTVVIKDYMILKDLFKQLAACGRPEGAFEILPDGAGFGEKNGPEWIEQRRYTVQKMKNLGFSASSWEKTVQAEVLSFLDQLSEFKGQPLDINKILSASISNNVMSLVSGNRLPVGHPARNIIDSGVYAFETAFKMGAFIMMFPKLYEIAVRIGLIRTTEKLKAMGEMNKYIRNTVEDPRGSEENSYIQEYKEEIEEKATMKAASSFNVSNLVGNVQVLIIAGSGSTKVALQWLFLAMASFPEIQKNVHQELDSILEREPLTKWQDRQKLPYCHATILEAQRWRSVAALGAIHTAHDDLAAGKFIIPKGSNIIPFIWGIHMDPKNWEDPETFKPERFLDENGSVIKNILNFAPFSLGKRACIGEIVAMIELFLYFVNIMQKFKILPPEGIKSLKLTGHLGAVLRPPEEKLRYIAR